MTQSRSRHLVDPQLAGLLEAFPTVNMSAATLADSRATPPALPIDPALIETTEMTTRTVPGPKGAPDIGLIIYRPKQPADATPGVMPCIYHIHGGGYVVGSASMMEGAQRALVTELGCVLVTVEYRLAPETPHPGPIEDCYAGLAWLYANAPELGVDRARIGVMGESAGGGLAAALALLARDRGEYPLAFQQLIYPMLDDRTAVGEPHPYTGEFIWTPESNHFGWSSLLGHEPGRPDVSPYAAPARAESLAGLPPTYLSTGSLDLFLEEDLEYARRLIRAGVPVELHVYPGAVHAFDFAAFSPVSVQAINDSKAALRRALFPGQAGG
jgi:acetyl esterase/lipase